MNMNADVDKQPGRVERREAENLLPSPAVTLKENVPLVSIGLPVHNGEAFLHQALDSLLSQTFEDFELIISDNASTDRTREICLARAARDPRIRYFRNDTNQGAAYNFNRVFTLARGKYFKWAAHDDYCEPDFLQECVSILEGDSSVILCYPRAKVVDSEGHVLLEYHSTMTAAGSPLAHQRFDAVINRRPRCSEIFGLALCDALRHTRLIGSYIASDRALLAELALLGRFQEVPFCLLVNRDHAQRSVRLYPLRMRGGWFHPRLTGKIGFPTWKLLLEYAKCIFHVRAYLNWNERLLCSLRLILWLAEHKRGLAEDLLGAVTHFLRPSSPNLADRLEKKFRLMGQ
jgi:glycosyltransferase involved in cell wall biosynthesis